MAFTPRLSRGSRRSSPNRNLLLFHSIGYNIFRSCHAIHGVTTTFTGCLATFSRTELMYIPAGQTALTAPMTFERHRNSPNQTMGADRERAYYPAFYEFNPSVRSHVRPRSRRLILFSLGLERYTRSHTC